MIISEGGHPPRTGAPRFEQAVLAGQSGYLVLSAAWPLLHYRSFEAVTGEKHDDWLVRTLAAQTLGIAVALGLAARGPARTVEARTLGIASAAALCWASAWYAAKGRISSIYLVDAAVELALLGCWLLALIRSRRDA